MRKTWLFALAVVVVGALAGVAIAGRPEPVDPFVLDPNVTVSIDTGATSEARLNHHDEPGNDGDDRVDDDRLPLHRRPRRDRYDQHVDHVDHRCADDHRNGDDHDDRRSIAARPGSAGACQWRWSLQACQHHRRADQSAGLHHRSR